MRTPKSGTGADDIKQQIVQLVEYVRNDTLNEYAEVNFGKLPNYRAQEINALTGVFVRGADKKITSHGIRHALSRHRDQKEEGERGQIGLRDGDFVYIPDVVNNPDSHEKGNKKNTVMFVKRMKGLCYHVVMGMVKNKEGGQDLVFHTMFIKK